MDRYIPVMTALAVLALFSGNATGGGEKAAPESDGYVEWQARAYAINQTLGGLTGTAAECMKLAIER